MLAPEALLGHAGRLLTRQPDEADIRRAISACYYAVFDLLITAASQTQEGGTLLQDSVRRTVQHREVRRVCDAMVVRPASRPAALQQLLVEPVDQRLIRAATALIELLNARLEADYDLVKAPSLLQASALLAKAETVVADWPDLLQAPNTRTFLLALLFHERWTRRG